MRVNRLENFSSCYSVQLILAQHQLASIHKITLEASQLPQQAYPTMPIKLITLNYIETLPVVKMVSKDIIVCSFISLP